MFTVEEEGLNVVEFSVAEEEPVFTEKGSWVLSINSDGNITNIILISRLRISESNILEAHAASVDYSWLV